MAEDIIVTDFDGVICEKLNLKPSKKWNQLNGEDRQIYKAEYLRQIAIVKPLYIDYFKDKKFIVITARKQHTEAITEKWLAKHNLKPLHIFYMRYSNTKQNMIKHKAEVLKAMNYKQYIEDNLAICKGIKKIYPECCVLHFHDNILTEIK